MLTTKKIFILFITSVLFFTVFLVSCSQPVANNTKLSVLVSIVPQQYFVNRIAGDLVDIKVLIPPGASPTAYEISPSDMRIVNQADIWFTIGLQKEEEWKHDFPSINEALLIESTINDIQILPINRYAVGGTVSEEPEQQSLNSLAGDDPHVWLSPQLVALQAEEICRVLVKVDSVNSSVYTANLEVFLNEIRAFQDTTHNKLDPFIGKSFIVFHPAWGYFADEFGLNQVPIEIAGSEPTPSEMVEFIDFARGNSISVVFVSPQFSDLSASTIAEELDASVVVIDPLAFDWMENMKSVVLKLESALQ